MSTHGQSDHTYRNPDSVARERTSVVCVHDGRVLCIELEDPTTKKRMWSLPGGQLEPDESIQDCAKRETLEETGYQVELLGEQLTTQYQFRWNAKVYACTCHWFRAVTPHINPVIVEDASYLLGSFWLPIAKVPQLLSYHPHVAATASLLLKDF